MEDAFCVRDKKIEDIITNEFWIEQVKKRIKSLS